MYRPVAQKRTYNGGRRGASKHGRGAWGVLLLTTRFLRARCVCISMLLCMRHVPCGQHDQDDHYIKLAIPWLRYVQPQERVQPLPSYVAPDGSSS